LSPGDHKLRLSDLGYVDWTSTFSTTAAKATEITANLAASGPKALTIGEVEEALKNGVPKTRLIGFVNSYGVDFALSSENEQRLPNAGADSDLLLAIAKNKK